MTPDTRRVTLLEVNALVAEHVMGWPVYEQQPVGKSLHSHVLRERGEVFVIAARPGGALYEYWNPSTDWRHTGEALNKAPYSSRIDIDPDGYTSVAINDGSRGTLATAEAATKEAACCLSLVRAYGVEVELEAEEA